jgi:hypothetical protein
LLLLGALLTLITQLRWVLGALLVLVPLGVLAFVPLVGWPLVPLLKTLLRESSRASVATRRLSLELPLLEVHFLTLVINYNGTVHQLLETGIFVGHQLQLESIIQPLQKTALFVRIPSHFSRGISRQLCKLVAVFRHRHGPLLESPELLLLQFNKSLRDVIGPKALRELFPCDLWSILWTSILE